ncbi:hypothetical protein ABZX85_30410 [Streptomyces sp. NPDC004539]|uniref:hypothetical protein n=1 Tax=Streptomyces sp. NPDC004539 TaxID=3154280 RepID=UPI0033B49978
MIRRVWGVMSAAVVVCAVTAVQPAAASAGAVERISVAVDGMQGDGHSTGASITPDGRSVVFQSAATNLTAEGTTGGDRVYVRDLPAGPTRQMGGLVPVQPPVISGNGEYLAYPVQWFNDVRIRQYQVSTGRTASADCSAYSCNQPSLSADGRTLAHVIRFKAPLTGQRVEVQNWSTGAKETIADLAHTAPSRPSLSGDGRYVAYQDGQTQDVFVRDRTTGTTTGPVEGPGVAATLVQLSDGGGKVVYLAGPDTYVYDVLAGTTQLVPGVRGVAVDPTGRYLLHTPNDPNTPTLTLLDLSTGTEETVSDRPATAGPDAVSADGRDVVFQSTADDLVPGDTNGKTDVFVRHFS